MEVVKGQERDKGLPAEKWQGNRQRILHREQKVDQHEYA